MKPQASDWGRGARMFRCALGAAFCGCLLLLAGWLALPVVPLPPALFARQPPGWELLDRAGQSLRSVRADHGPFWHPVAYGEIPQSLVQATLAAEDRRFWQHHGVDWRAMARAAWQLAVHRRIISGGSTITQQLIKLAQPRPRTFRTKLIEAVQAMRLEQVWDKQQILAAYLDRIDYGNFNSGCGSAAQFYFGKPLGDLSAAECALLAGLPQAPTRLNPHPHLARAVKRARWILGQMHQGGWLTDSEYARAMEEPPRLAAVRRPFEAPHFVDLLLANAEWVEGGCTQIQTTLDLGLNRFAEDTLRQHLVRLRGQRVSKGAIVVIDNRSGDVLALVGSENYFAPRAGQVNGAWAPRSPGSALKPFTYLLALERGATPATVVADVPTEFATASGLFAPVNYNRHCYGPMRFRVALANSLNISAVKVLASVGGPEPLQQLLRQCGLSTLSRSPEEYGLGLTIGNAEVRLLELANAYACLARLGEFKPYRLSLDTAAGHGSSGSTGRTAMASRVADPAAAYLIADILSDNAARTLAFGAESPLRFSYPVACKTGTSSDFRDNWAFGYTPEFTVGIWVGNFDGSPMERVSGITGAAPILHDMMEHLHQQYGTSWYATPAEVVECWVNAITGKRLREVPTGDGGGVVREKFIARNLPEFESASDYEPGRRQATGSVGSQSRGRESRWVGGCGRVRLADEYREWLASDDNWLGNRAVVVPGQGPLRIVFPLPGTTVYLDPDLPQRGGCVHLRAEGAENLEWRSKTLPITQEGGRQMALLSQGQHELVARDPVSGRETRTWVNVLVR
jgi:penicillin-binding protein 1C